MEKWKKYLSSTDKELYEMEKRFNDLYFTDVDFKSKLDEEQFSDRYMYNVRRICQVMKTTPNPKKHIELSGLINLLSSSYMNRNVKKFKEVLVYVQKNLNQDMR